MKYDTAPLKNLMLSHTQPSPQQNFSTVNGVHQQAPRGVHNPDRHASRCTYNSWLRILGSPFAYPQPPQQVLLQLQKTFSLAYHSTTDELRELNIFSGTGRKLED